MDIRIMDLIIPDNWGVYSSYTTIFFSEINET